MEDENYDDQICGVVVNVRKGQDKLAVWTKDAENREACLKIG
jgi:translation initiation factor 4E